MQRNPTDIPIYDYLTPVEIDAIATECGPAWLPKFMKRHVKQHTFRESCRQHDADYWIGGSRKHRLRADKMFQIRMLESIPDNIHTGQMRRAAHRYYILVRRFGWISWHYGRQRTYLNLAQRVGEYLERESV